MLFSVFLVMMQVLSITLSSIQECENFKGQYMKYDCLWKQDLNQTLQVS
jgi:hypothetical protein